MEYIYMKDSEANYVKEFKATVISSGEDFVVLDKTAFYPQGGGQPSDQGFLKWGGGEARVREVIKKNGHHMLDKSIPKGTEVTGILDWDRRYGHMRMHTAQHLISGIIFDLFKATTSGNQIHADHSRIDFKGHTFKEEDLRIIEEKFNELASKNIPVDIYEETRTSLETRVDPRGIGLDLLPSSIKILRVVDIGGKDICPCAGTHVANTSELGTVKILKRESKGKDKQRITYTLLGEA